ncbi:2'-5' RNA ligase family protein [Chloroflexota bacterium]
MTQYAAALVFPAELSGWIDALRQEYLRYVNYSIEPHITLVYPFMPETDITVINKKIKQVAERTNSFTLILNGFEYFDGKNNVAYIAIENKQPVADLHYDINQSIGELVKDEFNGRFNLHSFISHVTIGEQIPNEVLRVAKKRLSEIEAHYEADITSFTLFCGSEDGVWTPAEVFLLTGDN